MKKTCIIALLLSITSYGSLFSQVLSNNGTFSIDFNRGCAPFTVNVNPILVIDPDVSRQYTYEGETTPVFATTHTYTEPGIYNIAQILGQDANKFDTLTVEVLDPVVPDFRINQCSGNGLAITPFGSDYDRFRIFFTSTDFVETDPGVSTAPFIYGNTGPQPIRVLGLYNGAQDNCGEVSRTVNTVEQLTSATITELNIARVGESDGAMQIRFNLGTDVAYNLEIATDEDPSYQFLQNVLNSSNLTISGLDTENRTFCFRLTVTDACTGETFTSNSACTADLTVEAMNGFNQIDLKKPPVLDGVIEILKDGSLLTTISDPNQSVVIDSLVTCGVENCYVLNIDQGSFTYSSVQKCAIGISITDPPPVNDITATVEGDDINLSWTIGENGVADTVIIRRARGNQSLSEIARTPDDQYVDSNPGVNNSSFVYDIFYTDACGNRSDTSNSAQSILLEGVNTTGNVYELSWNSYSGWFSGVANYFIQRLNPAGNVTEEVKILSGFTRQEVLTNLDREPVTFRIKAESLDLEPLEAFSNTLTFEFVPALFIPGAFTPNDDGLNDVLEVEGTFVASLEFKIFNRWGEVIFYSEDRNQGWDGTIGQKKAASGTYIYSLDFTDEQGKKFKKTGTFVLIR